MSIQPLGSFRTIAAVAARITAIVPAVGARGGLT
jgi:hypothetical protein